MILNLFSQVCEVMTAIHTGGRKYSVVLVDVRSGTDVYLNEVLLERNLALPDNIEQILEKLAPVHYEANDTSEECDVEVEDSVWNEGSFEFVIDDLQKFVGVSLPIYLI
jgi:hypothetical protein